MTRPKFADGGYVNTKDDFGPGLPPEAAKALPSTVQRQPRRVVVEGYWEGYEGGFRAHSVPVGLSVVVGLALLALLLGAAAFGFALGGGFA